VDLGASYPVWWGGLRGWCWLALMGRGRGVVERTIFPAWEGADRPLCPVLFVFRLFRPLKRHELQEDPGDPVGCRGPG
jgi:hypothetical protein